ncbi:binding-protein-dependent transport systems inner membrane component [Methanoregula boonei 6A8]|jgi:NitT/TauT family transport system permease protein|uniref:Binding-protein-dependent transport systems inner membrane component n=1 Tax=Methanoregula boonei (strain DSM 21154 / JCM 14090 / 6A8) TaxID=456442 RepID=A7I693_METB6|nr:ABC transporter permease [Methanoregula boonei]ABS55254.1 binding-protein-dependent transport systems inner membrane component [Methanoregula boonei 6A8]
MTRRLGLVLPILLIIGWEVAATIVNNPFFLPKLETVIPVLLSPFSDILGTGSLVDNALVSIERVVLGFALAAAVAIPLGIGMGRFAVLNDFFDTTIELLRPVPPLAWVPLALAWFKIGIVSIVFIIFIGAVFPILLNTVDGVRGVKNTWIEVCTTLGASERQILTKVILPGAAPTIWTGLRVGFGISWMCVVAAEILPGPTSGLGYLIMYAYNLGQINVIIAGIIVIGLIGLVIDQGFRAVEKRWFGWRGLER